MTSTKITYELSESETELLSVSSDNASAKEKAFMKAYKSVRDRYPSLTFHQAVHLCQGIDINSEDYRRNP